MYDVFLSHNRLEKPWVHEIYKLLAREGLSVFFNEEAIAVGENIVSAIERGLTESKHVLLVVSRASLVSRWVAMETHYAVHDDPDAEKRRVIPLILDGIDVSLLRPALRTLNCIDLADPRKREVRLRRVLRDLGVAQWHEVPLPAWPEQECAVELGSPAIKVGHAGTAKEWGWDGVKLLEEFIKLDYETLEDLVDSHEGTPAQWAPIFMEHPQTWRMLFDKPCHVFGYWHFAPLFPEDYRAALEGGLLDSQITADRTEYFEIPGRYRIYFVQVCLAPMYRVPRTVGLLFSTIFSVFQQLARDGVYVEELCANAYTLTGRAFVSDVPA